MSKEMFLCKKCKKKFELNKEVVQSGISTDFCSIECAYLFINGIKKRSRK